MQRKEKNNINMEPTETTDLSVSTTVSSEYFVPKPQQLLQILMQKWSKIMKKFDTIAQTDGLTHIEIIRRRELGIIM
ncbi:hypothetical protein PRIPAC_84129 [Pristionchus pacificus]|uniref:Uncharacterized protein n=1 Tax=Pristionchus pacificus TaxID=54126 RepID=A0A2A6BS70_PRIPA|nr:hypothetical protein PRIPAC_84129 [Pristionchus pacificus]|eukprot:PDM68754.1 hypothetical protein PRIPAC_47056 [Pristionchus pacificus]